MCFPRCYFHKLVSLLCEYKCNSFMYSLLTTYRRLLRDELFNAFEDFKKDTCTGWRCVFKDSKFGKFGKLFNNS